MRLFHGTERHGSYGDRKTEVQNECGDGVLAGWWLRTLFPGKTLGGGWGFGTSSQGQRPLEPFPIWSLNYPFGYEIIWSKNSTNLKLSPLDLSKEKALSKQGLKMLLKSWKNTQTETISNPWLHIGVLVMHVRQMVIDQNLQTIIEQKLQMKSTIGLWVTFEHS